MQNNNNTELKSIADIRVVAFIDIIGFKEIIRHSFKDLNFNKFLNLKNLLIKVFERATFTKEEAEPFFFHTIRATAFSDSVVISDLASDAGVISVLAKTNYFIELLLEEGLFCRGAVAVGRTYHDNNIIIGEGIINAYELESHAAVFPRVILSEDVAELAVDLKPILPGFTLKQDVDGYFYIDLFYNLRKERTKEESIAVLINIFKHMNNHNLGVPDIDSIIDLIENSKDFNFVQKDIEFIKSLNDRPFDPEKFKKISEQILQGCRECFASDSLGGPLGKMRWLANKFNEAVVDYLGDKYLNLKIPKHDISRAG